MAADYTGIAADYTGIAADYTGIVAGYSGIAADYTGIVDALDRYRRSGTPVQSGALTRWTMCQPAHNPPEEALRLSRIHI